MPELEKIAQRIFNDAGFILFNWAGGREDLNDWIKDSKSYIRAVHNLRVVDKELEQKFKREGGLYDVGILLQRIIKAMLNKKYQINIQVPHGAQVEQITDKNFGIHDIGIVTQEHPIEMNYYARGNAVYPNFIRCWMLGKDIEYEIHQIPVGSRMQIFSVPVPVLGRLGIKKKIQKSVLVYEEHKKFKTCKILPLSDIVKTNNNKPSYLMELMIQKHVPDSAGRSGGYPLLYVVAEKELVEHTVSFLLNHPNQYVQLIKCFIPTDKFPNVNRGILNIPDLNTKGLVFENYTNLTRIKID